MGLMMVSPKGRVLHVNRALAELTGLSAQSARGLPCKHVLRSRPCVSGCMLGCGSLGLYGFASCEALPSEPSALLQPPPAEFSGIETDILTMKKRKVPVRLTHFAARDEQGELLFFLDVVEDLTEVQLLKHRLHQSSGHGKLVGRSAAMERIAALVPSIAPSAAPVLLSGETGAGKDILAETLHQASPRSREPFVRLNISPLPDNLLLAELFGLCSAPGAGETSTPDRPGRFQQAAGGTLFISEVADIPKSIQPRLVTFLDEGLITPVGGGREVKLNVRLIAATNHKPEDLVRRGFLSAELFHRLSVVRLHLPPLRERREDIDFLLQHFLDLFSQRFKKSFSGFTPEARTLLASYAYPGNVRELKNIVEYAAMVCAEESIGINSLPAHLALAADSASDPAGEEQHGRSGAKRKKR